MYSPSTSELHLQLSSFDDTAGSIAFQTVEVRTQSVEGTVCAAQHALAVEGDGSSATPYRLYDDEAANHVVDITSGVGSWTPPYTTSTPFGWPLPPVGSWLGDGGFNPLLDAADQGELPLGTCVDGRHAFALEWTLTQARAITIVRRKTVCCHRVC